MIKNILCLFFIINQIFLEDQSLLEFKLRRPELSNHVTNKKSKKKYLLVLKSLIKGCQLLKKSKCKFIVIPCNTAHYWYDDLQKKINLPMINMPQEVYKQTLKKCKKKIFNRFIGY